MPTAPDLLVVGAGKMGHAIAAGLAAAGLAAASAGAGAAGATGTSGTTAASSGTTGDTSERTGTIALVEAAEGRRKELQDQGWTVYPTVGDAAEGPEPDVTANAMIAVKPHDVEAVCAELRRAGTRRVLSIAAGVTIADLEAWLGPDIAVVRAMPNTPALVGEAASAVAPGHRAGATDMEWARAVLGAVGRVVELSEPLLDSVTGLSGSGPAYVFLVVEALIEAGVLVGLPRATAKDLAVQTVLGSARLLAETGAEPADLRAAVTSPGGTTAAGVRALENRAVRAAITDAVVAATERARELGRPS